jgi:hypothetical protein
MVVFNSMARHSVASMRWRNIQFCLSWSWCAWQRLTYSYLSFAPPHFLSIGSSVAWLESDQIRSSGIFCRLLSDKALWGSWMHRLCVVSGGYWGMCVWHNNDNVDVCTRALAMVCCHILLLECEALNLWKMPPDSDR